MSQGIPYGGVLLDQQTISALQSAEGIAGFQFTLTQGSFTNAVAASAGTHSGGGAMDVSVDGLSTDQQVAIVRALRQSGFAAWRRTPSEGFVDHIHAILIGDPLLSSAAAAQVPAYQSGLDGLADNAPDTNPIDVAAGLILGTSPVSGVTSTGSTTTAGLPNPFTGILGGIGAGDIEKAIGDSITSVFKAIMGPLISTLTWGVEILLGAAIMGASAYLVARQSPEGQKVEGEVKSVATEAAMAVPK